MNKLIGLAAGLVLAAGAAQAGEKWDMPMAYADSNFHTQNGKLFAEAVGICTGGELEIVVHGGGSLFKGNEIKRAVQTGQAPIGERLLSAHQNENVLFGVDSVPFLASSFEASDKLWGAAKGKLTEILADQNLVLLYGVPWPPQGLYYKEEINSVADMKGIKFRAYNAATARLAELAKGKKRAVILFDDFTRPQPTHEILPAVLDELRAGGLADDAFRQGALRMGKEMLGPN